MDKGFLFGHKLKSPDHHISNTIVCMVALVLSLQVFPLPSPINYLCRAIFFMLAISLSDFENYLLHKTTSKLYWLSIIITSLLFLAFLWLGVETAFKRNVFAERLTLFAYALPALVTIVFDTYRRNKSYRGTHIAEK